MIPTSRGPMTGEQIVDDLSYACYAHNRRANPQIAPEAWARCWPGAREHEARFQAEEAIRKAAS